ncbi:MMB_0454 family protein [Metamycoplasma buccale]|uniref:MMB_0454 family protein n=1 Tax=Metamycoplasma buccale TaxID=55602 RepID=UPI00398F6125
MTRYINVNTKMNFSFFVEEEVIKEAIQKIFKNNKKVILTSQIEVSIDNTKENVDIRLHYKVKKFEDFTFETKQLMFLIEQTIFSLINTKPKNINLIFEGSEDEI